MFFDVLLDTILDCLKMLPFLLAAYFVIEYLERTQSEKLEHILAKGGKFGFIPGALLGLVPQCGFSGMAADLYSGNVITVGTLIAVFVATSDEAIPLLIANPDKWKGLALLLLLKLVFALLAGVIFDFVIRRIIPEKFKGGYRGKSEEVDCHDHDEHESLLVATLRHTAIIMASVFAVLLAINLIAAFLDADKISSLFSGSGIGQIFIAGLVGMIPNCASSVLLTQLYAQGNLCFAAMFAGLSSGSGIGTLILLRTEKNKRRAIGILALVYLYSVLISLLIDLFI